jgi:hypothetical protein
MAIILINTLNPSKGEKLISSRVIQNLEEIEKVIRIAQCDTIY